MQPRLFLGMTLQAWQTCIWGFLPFFSADPLKLCQVDGERWCTAIFRSLQRCLTPVWSSKCSGAGWCCCRISHWSPPKPIPPLAAFPSSSLLPMTGTNCKNLWSWRLISPSLALSTSCQSSSQITTPVHSPSVNSPSNYLIPILYIFIYLAPLYPSISTCTFIFCTSTIPVSNCYMVITSPPWPTYCPHLTSFTLTVYRFFFFLLYVC